MNEMPCRAFKGVWIPKRLWIDKTLTPTQKFLLAEISSYDNEDGCFASNEFLAEKMNTTPGTIRVMISQLRKAGWIKDKGAQFEGDCTRRLTVSFPKTSDTPLMVANAPVNGCYTPVIERTVEKTKQVLLLKEEPEPKEKENSAKEKETIPEDLDTAEFREKWEDFKADRKERRKPVTSRAAKALLTKMDEWGEEEAIEALGTAIEKGWSGVFRPNGNQNASQGKRERYQAPVVYEDEKPKPKKIRATPEQAHAAFAKVRAALGMIEAEEAEAKRARA